MNNVTGRPVEGEDFFGREADLERIWSALAADHVLLLAPRRVGKTSLMLRIGEEANQSEFRACYWSVADVASEAEFVERLSKLLSESDEAASVSRRWQGFLDPIRNNVKSLDLAAFGVEFRDPMSSAWRKAGNEIITALRRTSGKWLLLVDELPLFVMTLLREDPTGNRARTFLNWFRQLRQPSSKTGDTIRWMLAGSIGLDTVTKRVNMGDTINDLRIATLGAFDEKTARRFLERLAADYKTTLPKGAISQILKHVGWAIPYHLQLFFSGVRDSSARPSKRMIDEVKEELLSPAKRSYFDYWSQRLTEELGRPHDEYARALLRPCAHTPQGATASTLGAELTKLVGSLDERDRDLHWLLDVLQNDGYLIESGGRFQFRSNLLREFWVRRFPDGC